ncbi:uncharacterized protein LOC115692458 isoform X1 [Syzygium oleosum]|uniref:uncharacterized protein LOC115692458 isoform X1 n=1 Tax=Syzygium oleosum TaxID=219896 RepID=UPI0024B992ED|nr:uncharacterized protein LOC115692458 isoform X1 [Syzygium oleosum]XP_056160193.1 uncharacterized protein LOC115692458 isoform X1 [Syzygium oleosum]
MASGRGGLILDQNFNANYNGGSLGEISKVMKVQKKGGVGGRKPLGDLSNAGKPSLNQVSKKQNLKSFALINEDIGSSMVPSDLTKKRSTSKASDKAQTRSRRALSDISNSAKPHVSEASKKTVKMNVLAEEPIDTGLIAEEQFLHNHQECIKQQTIAMDMDLFLETLRLSSRDRLVSTPCLSPLSSRLKREKSPSRLLQYEQMAELQISAVRSPPKHELSSELDSPQPPSSPKSPNIRMHWKDQDMVNFMLMETPSLQH